jgi:hypothetical protein
MATKSEFSADTALVVGNDDEGWNVEYFDTDGKLVLRAGCIDKVDAEALAECLNNASWIDARAME